MDEIQTSSTETSTLSSTNNITETSTVSKTDSTNETETTSTTNISSNTSKNKSTSSSKQLIKNESNNITGTENESTELIEEEKSESKGKDKENIEEKDDFNDEESTIDRNLRIKRENHNALERKRRVYQKSKLEELKNRLPPLNTKKPSTIIIMCKAIEYIDSLKSSLEELQHQIDINALEKYKEEIKTLKKKHASLIKENQRLKNSLENSKSEERDKENETNKIIDNINNTSIINNNRINLNSKNNTNQEHLVEYPPSKKQKLNSSDENSSLINKSLDKDKKDKTEFQSISTSNAVLTSINSSGVNILKNAPLISSINNVSKIVNDENINQSNKIIEMPSALNSNIKSEISQHPIVNPILNKNESVATEKLISNNSNHITPSKSFMIQTMSSIPPSNNSTMSGITLQYSNAMKPMPLSTPPSSINLQSIPRMQEPSPLQVQTVQTKTSGQPIIIQHTPKSSIITPSATPLNSPILKDPLNQMNHQLINPMEVSKRNTIPMTSKVSSLNPSPIINHQSMPPNITSSPNNLQNPQGIFPSNLNVYHRTNSYPIQQSPHLSIQNQVSSQTSQVLQIASPLTMNNSPLTNPQIQILSTPNQVQPTVNLADNPNFQFQQNVAVQGQNMINIPSSESISMTQRTSPISHNFGQPNYYKQINNITHINPSIQVLQQPLPSNVITQNIINPQIQKTTNPPNNPNSNNNPNNIIYYYP